MILARGLCGWSTRNKRGWLEGRRLRLLKFPWSSACGRLANRHAETPTEFRGLAVIQRRIGRRSPLFISHAYFAAVHTAPTPCMAVASAHLPLPHATLTHPAHRRQQQQRALQRNSVTRPPPVCRTLVVAS